MTPLQYRAAIEKLGLSQRKAGTFLGAAERTSRRWAKDGPPEAVAKLLRLMIRLEIKPEDAR